MSELTQNIQELLLEGVQNKRIAKILGCSEARVSQVKSELTNDKQTETISMEEAASDEELLRLYQKARLEGKTELCFKMKQEIDARTDRCKNCPHKKKVNPLTDEEMALLKRGIYLAAQEECSRWTHNLTPEEIKEALEM